MISVNSSQQIQQKHEIYRYSSWNDILYNIFRLHNLLSTCRERKIRTFLLTSDRGECWLLKIILRLKFDLLNVTENKLWFQPECTGNGPDGQVGPSPRAFHIAIAIDCHMFVFGGRSGNKRSFFPLYVAPYWGHFMVQKFITIFSFSLFYEVND